MPRWTEEELERYEAQRRKTRDQVPKKPKPQGKPLIDVFCPKEPERLNKTETEFLAHLQWGMTESTGEARVLSQAIKFRMADKTWYRPDFMVVDHQSPIRIYEVKGFMRDDAAVKLKTCAEIYWMFEWFLVFKKKGGGWEIKRVGR